MARRSIPIEEKIETQKELVSKAKDRYENQESFYVRFFLKEKHIRAISDMPYK